MGDDVGHGDHLQIVLPAVADQIGNPGHGAVGVHDLADHTGGLKAGQARQVNGGLGLAGALEYAERPGPEREHVAGLDEVTGTRIGVDRHLDRVCSVGGGDAGGDALAGLDRHRERRLERRHVVMGHHVEAELLDPLRRERQADQTARVGGHEVDGLRRDVLRGHDQVALVLAVGRIDHHHHLARADVVDRFLNGRKRRHLEFGVHLLEARISVHPAPMVPHRR